MNVFKFLGDFQIDENLFTYTILGLYIFHKLRKIKLWILFFLILMSLTDLVSFYLGVFVYA